MNRFLILIFSTTLLILCSLVLHDGFIYWYQQSHVMKRDLSWGLLLNACFTICYFLATSYYVLKIWINPTVEKILLILFYLFLALFLARYYFTYPNRSLLFVVSMSISFLLPIQLIKMLQKNN